EHVIDALHLLLNRCRNRLLNRLSIRADVIGLKENFGRCEVGALLDWQPSDGDDTDDHHQDGNADCYDRVIDEKSAHRGSIVGAAAAGCAAAVVVSGFGLTVKPPRTFWTPSATTRSPGFNPCSMIQSVPTRSPTLTGRI